MPFTFCMIRHIICTSRSLNVENLLLTIERHRIFDHWDSHHKQCALCSFKHTISTVCVVSWIIRTDIGWNKKLTNMTSVFLFVCFFLCIALRMLLFIHRNKKGIKMTEKTIVAVLCLAWYVIRKRQLPPSRSICRLRCVVGHLTLGAIHRAFVCSIRIWCVLCFFCILQTHWKNYIPLFLFWSEMLPQSDRTRFILHLALVRPTKLIFSYIRYTYTIIR